MSLSRLVANLISETLNIPLEEDNAHPLDRHIMQRWKNIRAQAIREKLFIKDETQTSLFEKLATDDVEERIQIALKNRFVDTNVRDGFFSDYKHHPRKQEVQKYYIPVNTLEFYLVMKHYLKDSQPDQPFYAFTASFDDNISPSGFISNLLATILRSYAPAFILKNLVDNLIYESRNVYIPNEDNDVFIPYVMRHWERIREEACKLGVFTQNEPRSSLLEKLFQLNLLANKYAKFENFPVEDAFHQHEHAIHHVAVNPLEFWLVINAYLVNTPKLASWGISGCSPLVRVNVDQPSAAVVGLLSVIIEGQYPMKGYDFMRTEIERLEEEEKTLPANSEKKSTRLRAALNRAEHAGTKDIRDDEGIQEALKYHRKFGLFGLMNTTSQILQKKYFEPAAPIASSSNQN